MCINCHPALVKNLIPFLCEANKKMNVKFSPTEHLLWQDFSLVHLMSLLPFFICMSNCVICNLCS